MIDPITVAFFVPGVPATAGSKRGMVHPKTGRVVIIDSCKSGRQWRSLCVDAARAVYEGPPLVYAVAIDVTIQIPRPRSHFRKSGTLSPAAPAWPTTRPDLGKYLRAIEDALTGIIYRDDSQIISLTAHKIYNESPGVSVKITCK